MIFKIENTDANSNARAAEITLSNGKIKTPIFMPVGTLGTVKGVTQNDLCDKIKAQIILGNTYHLYLRPGTDTIKNANGLHRFINWGLPILTDSGGYQVYSLASSRKITEEGVAFQSHIDGSKHFFSPEKAIDIQREIGADIIMAFDECTPYPCQRKYAKESMSLTHRWLDRCLQQYNNSEPLYDHIQELFPIVQGSSYRGLRVQSAEYIASKRANGNAIGGLSVGEPADVMYDMCQTVCNILPKERPRYLMGVGTPENILECIALGIDMFDCVMPTRNGRNGMLFTTNGIINIKNKKWENDNSYIDSNLENGVSNVYSKAYLRHLIIAKEMLGAQIASINNLSFYLYIVTLARKRIIDNSFTLWKEKAIKQYMQRL